MDQKQVELQFALARLLQFKTLEKNETQFLKDQLNAGNAEVAALGSELDGPKFEKFGAAVRAYLTKNPAPSDAVVSAAAAEKKAEEKKKFRPSGIQVQKSVLQEAVGTSEDAHRKERALQPPSTRQSTGVPVVSAKHGQR